MSRRTIFQTALGPSLAALLVACGGSGGPQGRGEADASIDGSERIGSAGDGRSADASDGSLTLSLDPTLDLLGDDTKAASIASAVLLGQNSAIVATADIGAQGAIFNLAGITAGDYFVEINGDTADLVPTRIDDPTQSVSQRVGRTLRPSYIGPSRAPVYRINTYPKGRSSSFPMGYQSREGGLTSW